MKNSMLRMPVIINGGIKDVTMSGMDIDGDYIVDSNPSWFTTSVKDLTIEDAIKASNAGVNIVMGNGKIQTIYFEGWN